jgi:hypothetical protein
MRYRYRSRGEGRAKLFLILAVVAVLTLIVAYPVALFSSQRTITFTVTRTESVGHKYLIFTDAGVFENNDAMLFGKMYSSELCSQLHAGQTYTAEVVGWRAPFLSWYPNIIRVEAAR